MPRCADGSFSGWKAVKGSTMVNGFIKAQTIRRAEADEEELSISDDLEGLHEVLAALFYSEDSEDSDFEGFDLSRTSLKLNKKPPALVRASTASKERYNHEKSTKYRIYKKNSQ